MGPPGHDGRGAADSRPPLTAAIDGRVVVAGGVAEPVDRDVVAPAQLFAGVLRPVRATPPRPSVIRSAWSEALRVELPAGRDEARGLRLRLRPPCEGGSPLSWMFSSPTQPRPRSTGSACDVLRVVAVVEAQHDRLAGPERGSFAPVGRELVERHRVPPGGRQRVHLFGELARRHVQARERRARRRGGDHVVHQDRHGGVARVPARARALVALRPVEPRRAAAWPDAPAAPLAAAAPDPREPPGGAGCRPASRPPPELSSDRAGPPPASTAAAPADRAAAGGACAYAGGPGAGPAGCRRRAARARQSPARLVGSGWPAGGGSSASSCGTVTGFSPFARSSADDDRQRFDGLRCACRRRRA